MKQIPALVALLLLHPAQAIEVNASLDWANQRVLAYAVQGVVDKVDVVSGEQVKKNQAMSNLVASHFTFRVRKTQALLDGIKPRLFDAKLNFDQAQELYDRTVLSQVELQRAEMAYQAIEAEQAAARADLDLARWQQQQSRLVSPCDCVVVSSSLLPGMVINDENQSDAMLVLADSGVMYAEFVPDPNVRLNLQQQVQVSVSGRKFTATVIAIYVKNGKRMAQARFSHDVAMPLHAGQDATVMY